MYMKESFTVVEPWQGVACAVGLQKLQLVGSGDDLTGLGPVLGVTLSMPRLWRLSGVALGALSVSHLHDSRVQDLLLGGLLLDHGLKHGHLILQRLHLDFNGVEATKDSIEC
jgi:hypothetical protein